MIYIKILIIILLIIIIINLFNKETFLDTENDKINFIIKKKGAQSIELNWVKQSLNVKKYIIKMFINDEGPFIEILNVNLDDMNNKYTINNIKLNTIYKIGLASMNNNNEINNFNIKEFMLNSYDNDITMNYKQSFDNNIMCSPDGQHVKLSGECLNFDNNYSNYIQAKDDDKNDFSETNYNKLMQDLNKKTSLDFSLVKDNSNNDYTFNLNKIIA